LQDPSNSISAVTTVHKHPDFRLIATQNPTSGYFRGKREQLSSALLNRFNPIVFKELPRDEWVMVVRERLQASAPDWHTNEVDAVAQSMVALHCGIQEAIHSTSQLFPEVSRRGGVVLILCLWNFLRRISGPH